MSNTVTVILPKKLSKNMNGGPIQCCLMYYIQIVYCNVYTAHGTFICMYILQMDCIVQQLFSLYYTTVYIYCTMYKVRTRIYLYLIYQI